jgi:hypothetical protein
MAGELILFVVIVAVVAVAGIRLGMLLAPGLGRIAGSEEEDERGEDD